MSKLSPTFLRYDNSVEHIAPDEAEATDALARQFPEIGAITYRDSTSRLRASLPSRKLPGATSATTRLIPGCRSARGTILQRIAHSAALCAVAARSISDRSRFGAPATAVRSRALRPLTLTCASNASERLMFTRRKDPPCLKKSIITVGASLAPRP